MRPLLAAVVFLCLGVGAFCVRAETWSPMYNLSQSAGYNRWACVVGDAAGWHYTYMQGAVDSGDTNAWRLFYREQLTGGGWSSPLQIGNVTRCEESRIDKYSDGTRFVVFQGRPGGTDEWMISENSGSGWSSPVYLTPNDGQADLCTDANRILDVDSTDTIHLLSQHNDGSQWNMRYYRKPRGGAMVDLGDVVPSGDYQINGAVRVTGSGASQAVHFLVAGGATVPAWRCYYRHYQNGAFGPIINLSNIVASQPAGAHAGDIVQLPSGKLIACLATHDAATSGDWEVWLLQSTDNGSSWNTPINVSETPNISRNPSCSVDSQGEVVVAWEEAGINPVTIYGRRWRPSTGLGQRHTLGPGFTIDVASYGTLTRAVWHNSSLTGDWEIVTSETSAIDTQPPGPATQFVVTAGNTQNALSWHLPDDDDTAGARLRYRTDHFPTSATDGTFIADFAGAPSSIGAYLHTGLTNGVTHYYGLFAYDDVNNYASPATASGRPALRLDYDRDGDVDMTDFAHVQACLAGPNIPPLAGCEDTQLDADFDVDLDDLAILLGCLNGPKQYANPSCAE